MTEHQKRQMKRGAASIGVALVLSLVAAAAGAVWTVSTAIGKVSNATAITAAKETEHEAQDNKESAQLNETISKMDDKITLLLRAQGITESQVSAISKR